MTYKNECVSVSDLIEDAYHFLYSPYLDCLTQYPIEPCPKQAFSSIGLICIGTTSLVASLDGLVPILNALSSLDSTIAYFLHVSKKLGVKAYIGIKAKCLDTAILLLQSGILASYPEIILTVIPPKDTACLLDDVLINTNKYCSLSIASFIPAIFQADTTATLMHSFLTAIGDYNYTLLLLSKSVQRQCIYELISHLETLSTKLSKYVSITHSSNIRDFCNENKSTTKSESTSNVCTDNITDTNSKGNTISTGDVTSYSGNGKVVDNITTTITTSCNKGVSSNQVDNHSHALTDSKTTSLSTTETDGTGTGHEHGSSCSYRKDNKTATTLIAQINVMLTRLYGLLYTSRYDFAAYFLSDIAAVNIRSAYTYVNLFSNTTLNITPFAINTWSHTEPEFNTICNYLKSLSHPVFLYQKCCLITPCLLVNANEFKSLIYIPVVTN
ncbi:MAG: hypothetical protein AB9856_17090 [Cellulosilyticaceae bacterium]